MISTAIGIFAKIFTISFIRYLVFGGIAYLFFYVWKKEKFLSHKIQNKFPTNLVIRNEFVYSLISILLFSLVGVGVSLLHRAGYTKIYETFSDYGWGYFLLSTLLMILAHDNYFYWMHRLIHDKRIYKYVHKVLHQSINPTPWAAFSFHPTEAILEATNNKLSIELLGESKFKGGDRRTVNIMVCRGTERKVVAGAEIMLKVLGSSFRPVIFHAKSDANGLAKIHMQLPHFEAGRAALLIRAIAAGEEIELRRVVTPG